MSNLYILSKLIAFNSDNFAKYSELNTYLQTKNFDAYNVVHNTATNEISILGPKGAALTVYTNSTGKKYITIKKYYLMLDDVLNMITKTNYNLSKGFAELLVYSTKYKVSQYFVNAGIDDVIRRFKSRLKDDTIEITDFTFVDVINNKTLSVKPVVKVIDYIVE